MIKLTAILKEVSEQQSRDMVNGIADILRDVRDKENRREIANRMVKKFKREGVQHEEEAFMKKCGLPKE